MQSANFPSLAKYYGWKDVGPTSGTPWGGDSAPDTAPMRSSFSQIRKQNELQYGSLSHTIQNNILILDDGDLNEMCIFLVKKNDLCIYFRDFNRTT